MVHEITLSESQDIFHSTLDWIFLLSKYNQSNLLFITKEMFIIDEMWHNFILFTEDYNNFCLNYFKRFIHHNPSIKKIILSPKQLGKMYGIIYDEFGETVLNKWFIEYGKYLKN